jgi:hypothetical protein
LSGEVSIPFRLLNLVELSSGQNPKPTDEEAEIVREIFGWEMP